MIKIRRTYQIFNNIIKHFIVDNPTREKVDTITGYNIYGFPHELYDRDMIRYMENTYYFYWLEFWGAFTTLEYSKDEINAYFKLLGKNTEVNCIPDHLFRLSLRDETQKTGDFQKIVEIISHVFDVYSDTEETTREWLEKLINTISFGSNGEFYRKYAANPMKLTPLLDFIFVHKKFVATTHEIAKTLTVLPFNKTFMDHMRNMLNPNLFSDHDFVFEVLRIASIRSNIDTYLAYFTEILGEPPLQEVQRLNEWYENQYTHFEDYDTRCPYNIPSDIDAAQSRLIDYQLSYKAQTFDTLYFYSQHWQEINTHEFTYTIVYPDFENIVFNAPTDAVCDMLSSLNRLTLENYHVSAVGFILSMKTGHVLNVFYENNTEADAYIMDIYLTLMSHTQ